MRPPPPARRTSCHRSTHSKPVIGGTLKIVGAGDVDHLDTCCAYYTTTYELLRAVSRQFVSYKTSSADPAPPTPVPDMATYTISPSGLVYTFKIKPGVDWDTPSGPVPVTSQDEVLGLKRLCNPVVRAPPLSYWEDNIAGMKSYCAGFAEVEAAEQPDGRDRRHQELHRRSPDQRSVHPQLLDHLDHLDAPGKQLHQHHGAADELAGPAADPQLHSRLGAGRGALHLGRPIHDHELQPGPQLHARQEPVLEAEHRHAPPPVLQRHRHHDGRERRPRSSSSSRPEAPTSSGTRRCRPPTSSH